MTAHSLVMRHNLSKDKAGEITQLLLQSEKGGDTAFSLAVEHLYPELRRLAGFHAGKNGLATLAATDILHETYLKLSVHDGSYNNKNHFMSVASRAMRQIIIDYARRKSAHKRGSDLQRVDLDEEQTGITEQASELVLIDQLLERLSHENARAAKVFECRFFGGMNDHETSDALGISLRTAQRDWMKAKAFLSFHWESDNLSE